MTRFARFGERNKKPQEASDWSDLKGQKQQGSGRGQQETVETNALSQGEGQSKTETIGKVEQNSPLRGVKANKNFKSDKKLSGKFGKKKDGKFNKKNPFFSEKPRDYSSLECYNCKEKGHKASDCPKPSDGKHLEFECYNCKEKGHKAFQCPKGVNERRDKRFARQKDGNKFAKFDKSDKNWKEKRSDFRRVKRQTDTQNKMHCFNCRETGHQLSECPKLKKDVEHGTGICFKCGSTEHSIHKCHVKLAPGEFPYAKCFICKETGHLSRQCPDNPRGLYPNGGCCNECGSVEHLRRDCPDFQKQRGIDSITLARVGGDQKSADADDAVVSPDIDADMEDKPRAKITKTPKIVKF